MNGRRAIAAFVSFAFATLLCAPAFAGFWALADALADGDGCCCAKEVKRPIESVQKESCACPSCLCSLQEAPTLATLHLMASESNGPTHAVVLHDASDFADAPVADGRRLVTPRLARGPPGSTPLYLLNESLLI